MQINGGVRFCEPGMRASIRAMHVQSEILGMINENVTGFDKVALFFGECIRRLGDVPVGGGAVLQISQQRVLREKIQRGLFPIAVVVLQLLKELGRYHSHSIEPEHMGRTLLAHVSLFSIGVIDRQRFVLGDQIIHAVF